MIDLGGLQFSEETLIADKLAVVGSTGSGKTYVTRKIINQAGMQVIIFDLDGEYQFGTKKPLEFGFLERPEWAGEYYAKHPTKNCVIDHRRRDFERNMNECRDFVIALYDAKREKKYQTPTLFVIEEAYYYAPEKGVPSPKGVVKGTSEYALFTVQARGRKRGIGAIILTQRPAQCSKHVLGQCTKWLIFRMNLPNDLVWLRQQGFERELVGQVKSLKTGECVAVGFQDDPFTVQVSP